MLGKCYLERRSDGAVERKRAFPVPPFFSLRYPGGIQKGSEKGRAFLRSCRGIPQCNLNFPSIARFFLPSSERRFPLPHLFEGNSLSISIFPFHRVQTHCTTGGLHSCGGRPLLAPMHPLLLQPCCFPDCGPFSSDRGRGHERVVRRKLITALHAFAKENARKNI